MTNSVSNIEEQGRTGDIPHPFTGHFSMKWYHTRASRHSFCNQSNAGSKKRSRRNSERPVRYQHPWRNSILRNRASEKLTIDASAEAKSNSLSNDFQYLISGRISNVFVVLCTRIRYNQGDAEASSELNPIIRGWLSLLRIPNEKFTFNHRNLRRWN